MYNKINYKYLKFNKTLKKPKINLKNKLVIYGAGDMCKMALGFFKLNNININFIIDKNVENILSYSVYKPNKLNDLDLNTNLCICNSKKNFFIIYNKLKLIGFKNVYHFYEYTEIFKKKFYLSNGWCFKKKNLNFFFYTTST